MCPLPSHESLVAELREVRRRGLPGLRHCTRDALREAATAAGLCTGPDDEQTGIEELLGAAVRRLAGGRPVRDDDSSDPLARAAAHSFGIFAARRGVPGTDRRKAAAAVYGVTTERFRKSQEHDVVAELAAAVLAIAREAGVRQQADGVAELTAPATEAPPVHTVPPARTAPPAGGFPGQRPAVRPVAAGAAAPAGRITVRVCPIEEVRDVDILVSSENTYLEMSKTFRPTVSGALRRAAALRDASGEIVDDVLSRELGVWLRTHGRSGRPVRPGTVIATSSGALAAQGVRRIHHAAIATPVGGGDRYHVSPAVLGEVVRTSFELARHESEFLSLPMSSICFPLLGAGRGGLPVETVARRLLDAVRAELHRDPSWSVLMVTPEESHARLLTAASSAP